MLIKVPLLGILLEIPPEGVARNTACHSNADMGRLRGTPSCVRRLLVCILWLPKPPLYKKTHQMLLCREPSWAQGSQYVNRAWNSKAFRSNTAR